MTGPAANPNVSQACAACKHQRRKCVPDCPLAPFFPPHRHKEFLNAHKLFGIRNIMNTIKDVEPTRRETAVKSMIFQANVRASDPVGGCYRIINDLEQRYGQAKAELDFVLHQLAICRAQANGQFQNLSFCYETAQHPPIQEPSYYIGDEQMQPHDYNHVPIKIHTDTMKVNSEASSSSRQGNMENVPTIKVSSEGSSNIEKVPAMKVDTKAASSVEKVSTMKMDTKATCFVDNVAEDIKPILGEQYIPIESN